jgi:hypothetical protein
MPNSTIRRGSVLKQLDIKETRLGKPATFSISFCTSKGERVFLPRAMSIGLPWNLKNNRQRGILPVDQDFNKTGHVYPVSIDLILEFNNQEVVL